MKLYEIIVRSSFDSGYYKTTLVMSATPITPETEGVSVMVGGLDDEWGEYVASVSEKKVLISASSDEEFSDMAGVLSQFGQ